MSKDRADDREGRDLESPDLSVNPSTTLIGPHDDDGEVAVDASAIAVTGPKRPAEDKPRTARAPVVTRSDRPAADATLLGLPNKPAAAPPPPGPSRALSLGEALGMPVRIAGSALPLWAPALCGVLIACTIAVGVGALRDPPVAPARPETTTTTADPTSVASLEDRAAAGDAEALAQIAERPTEQRTSREVIALSHGRRVQAVAAAAALAQRLADNPALRHDPEVQAELRKYAQQPETHREALGAIAAMPGAESADMLYAIWTGTAARTDTTRLAEELVYSADVRAKASPSLLVVLDLWRADSCERVKDVLARVSEHGDHRALGRLNLLRPTSGCGDDHQQDCFPCLRDDDALDRAIEAASRRPPPR